MNGNYVEHYVITREELEKVQNMGLTINAQKMMLNDEGSAEGEKDQFSNRDRQWVHASFGF